MPACATALTLSRFALLACAMAAVGSPQRDRAKRAKVLTDEDLARLDEVWASDEEREEVRRAPESQAVDVEALQGAGLSQVQNLLRSQPSSGPAMMFAEVDYPGCCQDEGKTKELSQRWDAMLHTAGMAVQTYVIDPGTILFSTQHGSHAGEMRDFVLQQPECVSLDWNGQRTSGPAETEERRGKDAAKKAARAAEQAADKGTQEAGRDREKQRRRRRKRKGKAAAAKDEV